MKNRLKSAVVFVLMLSHVLAAQEDAPRPFEDDAYTKAAFKELPAELPITLAGTQILVDGVHINGTGPYRFLLDTGGMGGGRVDSSIAKKLGLESVDTVQAGDGTDRPTVTLPVYQLDELRLGPATFHGVRVLSRDYNKHGAAVRGRIDGVLGFHLFRELLLTIDYPGEKIRLAQGALPEPDGNDVIAYDPEAFVPTIEVTLAGKKYEAHLDSGSMGGITVSEAISEELPLAGEPRKIGEARTLTGAFPIYLVGLDGDFAFGGHVLEKPDIVIGGPMAGVNIGGRTLKDFVVTFDQVSSRVRFTRPEADENE